MDHEPVLHIRVYSNMHIPGSSIAAGRYFPGFDMIHGSRVLGHRAELLPGHEACKQRIMRGQRRVPWIFNHQSVLHSNPR